MSRSFHFQITVVFFLFLNCKETRTETSSISFYIPANKSQNVVVDLSNLFSSNEIESLAHKIIQHEKSTTNEIAILTIDSLPNNINIQPYGTQVSNSWGVGKKEKDNGLLITISKFDRKVAISTGLSTEKMISDFECKVIIDSIMIPQFKTNDYYKGVNKALDSLFILWD